MTPSGSMQEDGEVAHVLGERREGALRHARRGQPRVRIARGARPRRGVRRLAAAERGLALARLAARVARPGRAGAPPVHPSRSRPAPAPLDGVFLMHGAPFSRTRASGRSRLNPGLPAGLRRLSPSRRADHTSGATPSSGLTFCVAPFRTRFRPLPGRRARPGPAPPRGTAFRAGDSPLRQQPQTDRHVIHRINHVLPCSARETANFCIPASRRTGIPAP